MDRETYEKQKPFAGEKIPSMNRRCVGHYYQGRLSIRCSSQASGSVSRVVSSAVGQ